MVSLSPGRLLSVGAADDIHQLRDLAPLIGLVTGSDRMLDAMSHVVAQNLLLGASQCRAHGGDLGDNVNAVAVILDHAGEAADLAFDPAQTFSDGCLDVLAHGVYIPLPGIGYKAGVQE